MGDHVVSSAQHEFRLYKILVRCLYIYIKGEEKMMIIAVYILRWGGGGVREENGKHKNEWMGRGIETYSIFWLLTRPRPASPQE